MTKYCEYWIEIRSTKSARLTVKTLPGNMLDKIQCMSGNSRNIRISHYEIRNRAHHICKISYNGKEQNLTRLISSVVPDTSEFDIFKVPVVDRFILESVSGKVRIINKWNKTADNDS